MTSAQSVNSNQIPNTKCDAPAQRGHAVWVRLTHGIFAIGVLVLMLSGFAILMVHPRLYWGEVGNDLTPALVELPISRNYRHGGWTPGESFPVAGEPVSAQRTYDIFNQNGWARSLHFLAAWCVSAALLLYLIRSVVGRHLWRDLLPGAAELRPRALWTDLLQHLKFRIAPAPGGPPYGLLQKCSYCVVVLVLLPLAIATGLAMSPMVSSALPGLVDVWGGTQSARTMHFAAFCLLVLFLLAHVLMVVLSGARRQLRAMTMGVTND